MGPTPAQALSFSDLPSVSQMLEDDTDYGEAAAAPPAPLPDEDREEKLASDAPVDLEVKPAAAEPHSPIKTQPVPPMPAAPMPAAPKSGMPSSSAPRFTVHGPPINKPKSPNPKAAIDSLLGELTLVGKLGAPSVIKIELPSDCEPDDIDVVVQIRQKDRILSEGRLKRPVPGKGIAAKVSVELKRS